MRRLLTILACSLLWLTAAAETDREPLYIVNGQVRSSVSDIPEKNIERIETLPANEQTVAQYGQKANNGVVIITLCYDQAAQFTAGDNFSEYIASKVKWKDNDPVARFVMRFTVCADGSVAEGNILQSTDKRFAKRVRSAFAASPKWQAATKRGVAVESEHLLVVQLPKGRKLPRQPYIIML
ncbi:MAG: TonB-dependent receptor [Alistipes sp.]|nr:TonB-dependent receptor [Alistipes sp.]